MAEESVSVETQPETTVETVSTETLNKPDTAKGKGVPVKKGKVLLHRLESAIEEGYRGFYRDWETDRKSTRLNSSHSAKSRMPSSA